MNKRKKGRKFNRKRDQRNSLMRSLAEALIKYERIETTEAKAKALRPIIEKYVTRSRNNSLHTQRLLRKTLTGKSTSKLINEIAPRFKNRPGGYTRIIKRGVRSRDSAKRAIIEFVEKGE